MNQTIDAMWHLSVSSLHRRRMTIWVTFLTKTTNTASNSSRNNDNNNIHLASFQNYNLNHRKGKKKKKRQDEVIKTAGSEIKTINMLRWMIYIFYVQYKSKIQKLYIQECIPRVQRHYSQRHTVHIDPMQRRQDLMNQDTGYWQTRVCVVCSRSC